MFPEYCGKDTSKDVSPYHSERGRLLRLLFPYPGTQPLLCKGLHFPGPLWGPLPRRRRGTLY